jgi:RecB family exonuclease
MNPVSPSSLKLYLQCPALYKARYITREYRPGTNRYLERGIRVHKLIEDELNGLSPDWAAEPAVRRNVAPLLERIARLRDQGFEARAELEAALDAAGGRVGWWDPAVLRSKIDLLLYHPGRDRRMIIDWKTGHTPGDPDVQLAINALCLYPDLGPGHYDAFFVYVDSGRETRHAFDLALPEFRPGGLTPELARGSGAAYALGRFLELLDAHGRDDFPATPNDRCRWCEWRGCGL